MSQPVSYGFCAKHGNQTDRLVILEVFEEKKPVGTEEGMATGRRLIKDQLHVCMFCLIDVLRRSAEITTWEIEEETNDVTG